jgi:hypothetical protein
MILPISASQVAMITDMNPTSIWDSLAYMQYLNHDRRQGHLEKECGVEKEGSQVQVLCNIKGKIEKEEPEEETAKK